MPFKVVCKRCHVPLYEGQELKAPYEIIEIYEGRCPNCARKLSHIPFSVEVKLCN